MGKNPKSLTKTGNTFHFHRGLKSSTLFSTQCRALSWVWEYSVPHTSIVGLIFTARKVAFQVR